MQCCSWKMLVKIVILLDDVNKGTLSCGSLRFSFPSQLMDIYWTVVIIKIINEFRCATYNVSLMRDLNGFFVLFCCFIIQTVKLNSLFTFRLFNTAEEELYFYVRLDVLIQHCWRRTVTKWINFLRFVSIPPMIV